MKYKQIITLLLCSIVFITGCGENSDDSLPKTEEEQNQAVYGIQNPSPDQLVMYHTVFNLRSVSRKCSNEGEELPAVHEYMKYKPVLNEVAQDFLKNIGQFGTFDNQLSSHSKMKAFISSELYEKKLHPTYDMVNVIVSSQYITKDNNEDERLYNVLYNTVNSASKAISYDNHGYNEKVDICKTLMNPNYKYIGYARDNNTSPYDLFRHEVLIFSVELEKK